jgi:Reverse transcriptase (RNA-dependent DNA polymerase)
LNKDEKLLHEIEEVFGILSPNDAFLSTLSFDEKPMSVGNYWAHVSMMQTQTDEDGLLDDLHPLAFAAKANNEDTPNFYQAMNGPDAEGYIQAMDDEYNSLDPWEEVPRSEAIEKAANILPSTWAFKCKRFPDGRIKKFKARWCIRGDRQIEGVDFFETYAPVVSWSTVRLLLISSIVLGLATTQVDYTLAFVQADLGEEIYCEMPKRYDRPRYIFKLKRSVYGLRQSPLNFFATLKKD